jgi:predicted glycosyltransferase
MTRHHRPRLLYYCLSLVGIGHLTASLQIISELLHNFDVDLIYGGLDYNNFPKHSGFRVLHLPTLLFNEAGELYSTEQTAIEETWHLRQDRIYDFLNCPYKGLIIEFYPFGRRKFKREIRSLINQVKLTSGDIPVFSQVREVLVPSDRAEEQKIMDIIDSEIQTVLVRGDPNVIKFDETFSLAPQLGDRLFYGGYISPPTPEFRLKRTNRIIVSQGGGNIGQQLLIAAIKTAALLPDFHFLVTTGSRATPAYIAYLAALSQSENVEVVPFLADFRGHLLTAALSINMGGDNTLMDVIATRTPSLAFPYPGNSEQTIRISKLAVHGWVSQLTEADLKPIQLKSRILSVIGKPYPTTSIDHNGAVNISRKIHDTIGEFTAE